jgi:hypothetical protein
MQKLSNYYNILILEIIMLIVSTEVYNVLESDDI